MSISTSGQDWWRNTPATPYATPTGIILSTGAQDIEKGNVYGVQAGTDISLPEKTKLLWSDSQHAVLQDTAGNYLNLLHVNTYAKAGDVIAANQPFAKVSNVVGSVSDPDGITYQESGNIVEFGLYSSKQGAINREVFVNGIDEANNFTGIVNPTDMLADWSKGTFNKNYVGGGGANLGDPNFAGVGAGGGGLLNLNPLSFIPGLSGGFPMWLLIVVVLLVFVFHKR